MEGVTSPQNTDKCDTGKNLVCVIGRGGQVGGSASQSSANAVAVTHTNIENHCNGLAPLYDTQLVGIEDKFVNTILNGVNTKQSHSPLSSKPDIYKEWERQSDFQFGFIPRSSQIMPVEDHI